MSFSGTRSLLALLAAALVGAASLGAGEFARPVPSDAQVTRFTRFNIRYSLRDVIADGVQKVEFYWTKDMGATWELYGADPDRMSPMTVEVPGEGVYGFVCVATDRYGNRERPPVARTRPETVIIVDRTPPDATWLSPRQDVLGRGQPVELSWESSDDYFGEAPVKIQYALGAQGNHDRNADWQTIGEDRPANGTFRWTPRESGTYNFRLIAEDRAGNMAVAYNPATITVDNTAPFIQSVSPLRSNTLENEITVEANDGPGGSGVKEFSLYYSDNNAATWTLLKETGPEGDSVAAKRRPGQTIPFIAPRSGEFPLWPVVFDEAGNYTALPTIAVTGPYVLVVDNEPPVVTLSSSFLMGRNAILANESRRVEWTSYDPHIENYSAAIHLSLDNGEHWQELLSRLPTSGSEIVNFPFGSQSEEARIRVTVRDEFGNVGEAVSDPFTLSGAETVIEAVTPVAEPGTPFGGSFGDGGFIQSPWPGSPAGSFDSGTGFLPSDNLYPADPMPQQIFPPVGGGVQGMDLFEQPALPADPILNGPAVDYNIESAASSMPHAMTREPAQQFPPPSSGQYAGQPVLPIPQQREEEEWNPSPGAGFGFPTAGLPGPSEGSFPAVQPPVGGLTPPFPGDTGSPLGEWQPTPAAPAPLPTMPGAPFEPAPPATEQPAVPARLPGFDDVSFGPPPVPGTTGADAQASSFGDPAGLGGFGGSLPLPAMPSEAVGGGGLQPPSPEGTGQAETSFPATQLPAMPTLPGLGESDSLAPPPITQIAPRPVNQRQESDRLVREAKGFRDDEMLDLALDRANRAREADPTNPAAHMELSQINARLLPPDFPRAANAAKEAANLDPSWETWWNCADVYYIWSHTTNKEIQNMFRAGRTPPIDLVDERNQTLRNADIAVDNAASVLPPGDREAAKKVTVTKGMVVYLRALSIPEPARPTETGGPLAEEYSRQMAAYKMAVMPLLQEALPYFQNARTMSGAPTYNECFQLGVINFRLAGLERDSGNMSQATTYYQEAVTYLQEATEASGAPSGGPREAYYMLALSNDELAKQPGANQTRNKEAAHRYWRQTADFYEQGSQYRIYAEQRMEALGHELGL